MGRGAAPAGIRALRNFMAERIWEFETVVAKKIGVACDSPTRSLEVTVAVVLLRIGSSDITHVAPVSQ